VRGNEALLAFILALPEDDHPLGSVKEVLKVSDLLAAEDATHLAQPGHRFRSSAVVEEVIAHVLCDLVQKGVVLVSDHVDAGYRDGASVDGLELDPHLGSPSVLQERAPGLRPDVTRIALRIHVELRESLAQSACSLVGPASEPPFDCSYDPHSLDSRRAPANAHAQTTRRPKSFHSRHFGSIRSSRSQSSTIERLAR
jgi:hypothetical protein